MAMPLGNVDDMLLRHQCRAMKCQVRQPFPHAVGKLQRNSSGFMPSAFTVYEISDESL